MTDCCVLVSNRAYIGKCLNTIRQLRANGRYMGEVIVIIGNDLKQSIDSLAGSKLGINPIYFPDIDRTAAISKLTKAEGPSGTVTSKSFQYHKFYCFHRFFKKWDKILYIDSGMHIYRPIEPLFNIDCSGKFVAHSDAYPTYEWTLSSQFNFQSLPESSAKINKIASLNSDYFQTTFFLYDTQIIEPESFEYLRQLSIEFPNSRTNDQGIINLWILNRKIWAPIPLLDASGRPIYDFFERDSRQPTDYMMLKYPRLPGNFGTRATAKLYKLFWELKTLKIR